MIKLENYVCRTQDRLKTNKRKPCITAVRSMSNLVTVETLHWRHNVPDSVSNHQPHYCLLNRLFRRRSKKTSKLRVTGLCAGNSPGPVNSPHKGPVTRKMFPFDDVIMVIFRPLYLPWCNFCGYFCNGSHCAIQTNSVVNFSRRIRYCDACITTIHQVLCYLLCNNLNG